MLQNFPVSIVKKKLIAKNTMELTFSVTDPNFSFKAGQYVSVEISSLGDVPVPDKYHDFSIASSPLRPNEISIAFRISQSVFKTALLALPLGGTVTIDGPKGSLILPEHPHTSVAYDDLLVIPSVPLVFVAGGIGITPFLSMIKYATEISSSQQITLLYCNSSRETTAYADELFLLEQKNPHFVLGSFLGIPDKNFFIPYAQNKKNANTRWYIVGAPAMVKKVRQILMEFGILETQIQTEEFSGYNKQ